MRLGRLAGPAIFAAAFGVAGLGVYAASAHAGVITLDVSATFFPSLYAPPCSSTCKLGGDVVIDNSLGAGNGGFVSADVTTSGFVTRPPSPPLPSIAPGVGPFMGLQHALMASPSLDTQIVLGDSGNVESLYLDFDAPNPDSFAGYTGGSITGGQVYIPFANVGAPVGTWDLTSGSLTVAPAPAPSIGRGLPVALAFAGMLFAAKLLHRFS